MASTVSLRFSDRLPPDEILFESIAVALEQCGYVVLPNALPEEIAQALVTLSQITTHDDFQPADVGRGSEQSRNQFVRRDQIHWLEPNEPHARLWLDWAQALKNFLNRRLFLGLFSFESHLAHYPPGAFYKKHYDAFRGQSNRVLSVVTYLNRGWEPDQGGELVIYGADDSELQKVTPAFGTLVIFLSEEFPHEVLPAVRDRYSVAGWFRVNGSINGQIDPPR